MDRLQALTVCVNYADLLECIAANKIHFDRWVIITHRKDKKTIKVCEKHGLEYIFSRRFYEGGATFHKAKALNDGLEYLGNSGWVVVIDSDVYLPSNFRRRLDCQKLNWRALYGLRGRRVCLDFEEFNILKEKEPWNLIWHSTSILGYFHLLHLSQTRNRYPEGHSKDASTYDMMYSDSFPEHLRKKLPIPCLHLGPVMENWKGRRSRKFRARPERHSVAGIPGGTTELLASAIPDSCRNGSVALVGYGPPRETVALAEVFSEVLLVDEWGYHQPHWDPLENADRKFLAGQFEDGTRHCANLRMLGKHSTENLAAVDNGSLQGIFLGGELDLDSLATIIPVWMTKLVPGGFIAGSGFGRPHFENMTQAITLTIGIPDFISADGTWLKWISRQISDRPARPTTALNKNGTLYPSALPLRHIDPLALDSPATMERGVLYFADDESDLEDLLVSVHSLRNHWEGPVCFIHRGEKRPALDLACNRYGVRLLQMSASDSDGSRAEARLRSLQWTPFVETLYLDNATIVLGRIEEYFELLREVDCLFSISPDEFKSIRLADLMRLSHPLEAQEFELAESFLNRPLVSLSCFAFKSNGATPSSRALHETAIHLARKAADAGCIQVEETVLQYLLPTLQYQTAPRKWTSFGESIENGIPPETRIYRHRGGFSSRADPYPDPLIARLEEQILDATSPTLRKPADLPLVTVVVPDNFAHFRQNIWMWKFEDSSPIYAVFTGIDEAIWRSLEWPDRLRILPVETNPLQDIEYNAGSALLKGIPGVTDSEFCIYLNAGCVPKPGTELFVSNNWRSFGLVGCGWTDVRSPPLQPMEIRNFLQMESPFKHVAFLHGIGLINMELWQEAAESLTGALDTRTIDELFTASAVFRGMKTAVIRAEKWGWDGC